MSDLKWLELSVSAPPEFVEPLSHIFYRYGHGGVALEQQGGFNPDEGETASETAWVTLKTYLPINESTDERRNRIDVGVRLVAHVGPVTELVARTVDEDEWQNSWKDHFQVLRVGRRLVVKPTWREYEPRPTDVVIVLDPGMAFGTGHHPTTRSCLEQLERMVAPGASVLDFGCGSGILSIAASKLGASSVLGVEADSSAVRVAKQNARENGVQHNVLVVEGTLPRPEAGPWRVRRGGGEHLGQGGIRSVDGVGEGRQARRSRHRVGDNRGQQGRRGAVDGRRGRGAVGHHRGRRLGHAGLLDRRLSFP